MPLLLAGLYVLLAGMPAAAQQRAQMVGVVRDGSGAVIVDVDVAVLNTDTGIRRATRTNSQGFYAVSSLTPGQYKVTVRKPGFRTIARTGVELQATQSARLDFLLELGAIQEVVTVEGDGAPIRSNDGASQILLGRDSVEALPLNGRGLQGVLEFAPGVLATPATGGEAGQFSANGQRPNTNYFTIDGVSANNGVSGSGLPGEFSGGALPGMTAIGSLHGLVALGAVQEVRIQTSSFTPEFGRLPGAQVAVITRSGSNEYHGEFFGGFRHERLNAMDWFANRAGLDRAPASLHTAGGLLSGPVRRNRTFFSLSGEWLRLRQRASWAMAVPSLATRARAPASVRPILDSYPVPRGSELSGGQAAHTAQTSWPARLATGSVRVDHGLGSRGLLFLRYTGTPSSSRVGYLQVNDARFRADSVTAGALVAVSPAVTNEARVNVSRASVHSAWAFATPDGAQPLDLAAILPPLTDPSRRVYGISVGGLQQRLTGDGGRSSQGQWNFIDTVSWNLGRHHVRFGLDYQRMTPRREEAINGVIGGWTDLNGLLGGDPAVVQYAVAGRGSSLIETFSAFAQDTWHAGPRLNVTYGTRWEVTPAPSFSGSSLGLGGVVSSGPVLAPLPAAERLAGNESPAWQSRWTQFAPRIGAAYRLDSEGLFVLRVGAGLFYDLGFSSSNDVLNGAPFNLWRTTLTVGAAEAAPQTVYRFDSDLRLPYSWQWNVTLERAFAGDTVVSAAYVGSAGRRLLRRESRPQAETEPARVVLATNRGAADYHSFQIQARRRLARGLRGLASWTWGHAIDNGSWDSATYLVHPGAGDYGASNFDVRHSLQLAAVWDVPYATGWTVSGIFRARTGFPVDVAARENAFGLSYDNLRPDLVAGAPLWIDDRDVPGGRRINPAAFVVPAGGGQGSLGRNVFRGFGLAQLDAMLERRFALRDDASLTFRAEAYNVTNHPNFADPVRFLNHPLFGRSLSQTNLMLGAGRPHSGLTPALQAGGARAVQLGVWLRF
ncbi:MAG: carboxypeptidase regulatory-like domain-containing protein [Bryobacteraceae bacterium]